MTRFSVKCSLLSGVLLVLSLLLSSCGQTRKLNAVLNRAMAPDLALAEDVAPSEISLDSPQRDTLKVMDEDGHEVLLMKAVRDENGEMVARDVIDPVVVTATFRNVAERHGKVDLRFDITFPHEMLDSRWSLCFVPLLGINGKVSRLDSLLVTGDEFKKLQDRGYRQYDRFLNSIIRNPDDFIRRRDMNLFLSREVRDVSVQETREHYTDQLLVSVNNRRISSVDRKYHRYVKSPYITEGLRLDTVIVSDVGNVNYSYVQTVDASPDVRKATIVLAGFLDDCSGTRYSLAGTDSLTFYISSISSLADIAEKYLTVVVERDVKENSVCWIEFEQGRTEVLEGLGNNASEIERIRDNMRQIMADASLTMDSVVVTASASPEGRYAANNALSMARSRSVCAYFGRGTADFIPHNQAENWPMLKYLVAEDPDMTETDKDDFASVLNEPDPDIRESLLSSRPYYRHLREILYPRLRTVKFEFCLHRKGMEKDTLHTTVLDTAYMRGVEAILARDYRAAIEQLRPYRDFNTALAYASMDYNVSAMDVLQSLGDSDRVNYLKALLYSRQGDDRSAVECYLRSCKQNPSFIHRGNLDPEISSLIRKYQIEKQLYDDSY